MKSISRWFCTSSTKNLFVKIVHPGGHVELHDRPIPAAELLRRNPKCCVAHPTVFQQPYAIVPPETTLALGQKYYVVPLGTIRKLQLKHPRSRFSENHVETSSNKTSIEKSIDDDDNTERSSSSACWLFRNSKSGVREEKEENGCLQSNSSGIKIKGAHSESSSKEANSVRKRKSVDYKDTSEGSGDRGGSLSSPGRLSLASLDSWKPGLGRVTEE